METGQRSCPQCATPLRESAKFCSKCGTPVAPITSKIPVPKSPGGADEVLNQKKKRRRNSGLEALGLGFFLLILSVAMDLVLFPPAKGPVPPTFGSLFGFADVVAIALMVLGAVYLFMSFK